MPLSVSMLTSVPNVHRHVLASAYNQALGVGADYVLFRCH